MLRFIFLCVTFYFLYKVIFDLIVPMSRVTSQVRRGVNEAAEAQRRQQEAQQQQARQQSTASTPKPAREDYIDFEEVKP